MNTELHRSVREIARKFTVGGSDEDSLSRALYFCRLASWCEAYRYVWKSALEHQLPDGHVGASVRAAVERLGRVQIGDTDPTSLPDFMAVDLLPLAAKWLSPWRERDQVSRVLDQQRTSGTYEVRRQVSTILMSNVSFSYHDDGRVMDDTIRHKPALLDDLRSSAIPVHRELEEWR